LGDQQVLINRAIIKTIPSRFTPIQVETMTMNRFECIGNDCSDLKILSKHAAEGKTRQHLNTLLLFSPVKRAPSQRQSRETMLFNLVLSGTIDRVKNSRTMAQNGEGENPYKSK